MPRVIIRLTNSQEVSRIMNDGAVWTVSAVTKATGLLPQQVSGVLGNWISKNLAAKVGEDGFQLLPRKAKAPRAKK